MPGIFNFPYLNLDSILSISEQEYALDKIHSFQKKKTNILLYVESGQLLLNAKLKYTLSPNELLIIPTDELVNFSATVPNTIALDIVFQTSSDHLETLYNNAFNISDRSLINKIIAESKIISDLRRRKPDMSYDMEIGEYFTASCASLYSNITSLLLNLSKIKIEETLPNTMKARNPNYLNQRKPIKKDIVHDQLIYAKKTSGSLYKKLLVNQIISYMENNLNHPLSINGISQEFLVGSSNLKKIFKSETKMSIITYFREIKMSKAKTLIQKNELTYTEIASNLGFSSVNHFSTAFKKYTGSSPTQFYKNTK